jgi:hypothetical protein
MLANKLGGYHKLPPSVQMDFEHCVAVNASLVQKVDHLKELSFMAYQAGDEDWQMDICQRLDEMEAKCL